MAAIASNVIVGSDDFRANRIAHLGLIAEFRTLERKVREASAEQTAKRRRAAEPLVYLRK
jgi:geranyl-CoA carboxylase beta subunit